MKQIVFSGDLCVRKNTLREAPVRREAARGKRSENPFPKNACIF